MKAHHIAITVNNLSESIHFYSGLFGCKLIKTFERPDLKGTAVFLTCDNIVLELWEFLDAKRDTPEINLKNTGIQHIAFETESVATFLEKLPPSASVPEIKTGASGAKYTFIKDPSGVSIEIYEPH